MYMNKEEYWAKIAYSNKDKLSEEAFKSSEIFSSYYYSMKKADAAIEKTKREAEESAMVSALGNMESLEEMISKDPALLNKFRSIKKFILENPDKIGDVDPNFINGINMLSLDGDVEDSDGFGGDE